VTVKADSEPFDMLAPSTWQGQVEKVLLISFLKNYKSLL